MSERLRCRNEDNCTYDSYCDGFRAGCPAPPPRPDMTECNSGTKVRGGAHTEHPGTRHGTARPDKNE